MGNRKRNPALNVRRKNRSKIIKTIAQFLILMVLAVILVDAIFDLDKYREPDRSSWHQEQGFIALSYFGVGRTATSKLVSKSQLDAQLKTLYEQGYRTISQQDVIDFYTKGKALPEKALFLSFEDGRNDSALFARPILEKYNFKATFLSYANKMGNSEHKFMQPKDMRKMTKSGYWELGTNGYRLTYINIFDKDGHYLGVKDEKELTRKSNVEYYNHYLMDFIRDENMIPLENRAEMEARISGDYDAMRDVYTNKLGYVPGVYMIMHANALGEGMNKLVTDANTDNIRKLFSMNFNREGNVYNTKRSDLYDLTRVQPASYWSTNHLLMKIRKDTGQDLQFVRGNREAADRWDVQSGAAEFAENRIILTSPPSGPGTVYLKDMQDKRDVTVTAKAEGNVVGRQSIYARYDRAKESFIRLTLENNEIHVEQKKTGQAPEEIYSYALPPVEWEEKDLQFDKASVYSREQTLSGARDDEQYPVNIRSARQLELAIQGDKLRVTVDNDVLLDHQLIDGSIDSGGVALESRYHEQNKKDDIYDAVFADVKVVSQDQNQTDDGKRVLFNNKPSGFAGMIGSIQKAYNTAVDWAIETF
ncbi:polysaccharide deacetylase family protein [Paenibacillus caui]|uniref:polysaccharide deacetylase family protein n=1 Tax=Paenibacillus caui TaxID=2873927 RepID=UPI001CA7E877|nr:polysaccharide deacetylase family protein [Paenibacillus caui]